MAPAVRYTAVPRQEQCANRTFLVLQPHIRQLLSAITGRNFLILTLFLRRVQGAGMVSPSLTAELWRHEQEQPVNGTFLESQP